MRHYKSKMQYTAVTLHMYTEHKVITQNNVKPNFLIALYIYYYTHLSYSELIYFETVREAIFRYLQITF